MYLDPRLDQAKRLLEQKNRDAARALLRGVLAENHEDVEALYLYALVVRTPADAEKVLRRVLLLDPLHYRAKAALNKLQNRSLKQLPPEHPASTFSPALVGIVVGVVLLVVAGALAGVYLLTNNANEPTTAMAAGQENALPAFTATTLLAQQPTERILPPTWTPLPTQTQVATRTIAPTMTTRPSQTHPPTFTPTTARVASMELNLGSMQRVFNEYRELAAQSSIAQQPETLTLIQAALQANIESLELSKQEAINQPWLAYADQLILLLQSEYNLAVSRANLLQVQQECAEVGECDQANSLKAQINQQMTLRLGYEEAVDQQLFLLAQQGTATAAWEMRVDLLRTPTVTPISLPSATPGN